MDCPAEGARHQGRDGTGSVRQHNDSPVHQSPRFLPLPPLDVDLGAAPGGGPQKEPDAFKVDWGKWNFVYLFPPPHTQVMLQVVTKLEKFPGQALLIAPYWETQPWLPLLLQLRPRTMALPLTSLLQVRSQQLMTSLRLTAWHFCGLP